jgi:hypothetical protein
MNEQTPKRYVLGYAPEELRRLILQAVILRPITARLLHDAEIAPGFRYVEEDLCGLSAFKERVGAETRLV